MGSRSPASPGSLAHQQNWLRQHAPHAFASPASPGVGDALGAVLPGARQLAADVGVQRQLDVPPVQVRLGLRVDAGVVCTCRGEEKGEESRKAEKKGRKDGM